MLLCTLPEAMPTDIAQIGEFGLIEKLAANFSCNQKTTVKGIGDDAAVIDVGDKYLLLSTDMLVEGIHFDLSYMPLRHLGYKAAAVNFSDIAAMNGKPSQMLISIAFSSRFSLEAVEEIYEGIKFACQNYGVDLVGGDTSSSVSGLMISVTAVGTVDKDKICYRSTAKPGDIICVTGDLGGAYTGLQILEREKKVFQSDPSIQPDLGNKEYIIRRQLKPEARTDVIHELLDAGVVPTSMIDISDGLSSEILHICRQSGAGAVLYEKHLPIDEVTAETALEFHLSPSVCALNGGEDYELLFMLPQESYEKIKHLSDITPIGVMKNASEGVMLITQNGDTVELKAQGWKHFK